MNIQDRVWETEFNEIDIMRRHSYLKPFARGEHAMGNKVHSVDCYKFRTEDHLILEWTICPDCKQLRNKRIVGLGKDADGYDTAFIKDLVVKGERV